MKIKSSVVGIMLALALFIFGMSCKDEGQKTAYPAYEAGSGTEPQTGSALTYDTSASVNTEMNTTENMAVAPVETTSPRASATTAKRKVKTTVGAVAANKSAKVEADKTGVYEYSEIRPMYVGGQSALEDYINNNVEYPQTAVDNGTQGTVNVQFTVDESGRISNAHVLGSKLGDGLDEEAVRVVSNLPKWSAGTVRGKNVKSKVTLPITFKIEE